MVRKLNLSPFDAHRLPRYGRSPAWVGGVSSVEWKALLESLLARSARVPVAVASPLVALGLARRSAQREASHQARGSACVALEHKPIGQPSGSSRVQR